MKDDEMTNSLALGSSLKFFIALEEEGREGGREGGREEGREGGRERWREEGREGERERGREGGRGGEGRDWSSEQALQFTRRN